ncbi:ISL3 family transposase [Paraburkholderia hospita]|uniref:ISL3 family transposase n=1 Tax=Paraburkholderia hospita TaxID=169430 RepID=UPI000B343776|nr:ISL3 family transposase [Paraburkholderia hospita]OUL74126.1 ISL3 family transposase [Paraburkholderia hospita]
MTNQTQLFEAALGIKAPWYVQGVDFGTELTIAVDFVVGSRFAYPGVPGEHPVHDTVIKRLRHLNFFQFDCYLEVRVPRVRLPDGSVRLVEPDWMGKLDGFTLLFEALVLTLCREMTFAAVARLVNLSWHRVKAICDRYVDLAVAATDLCDVSAVAIDETSCRRGHDYVSLVADMDQRRVVFVTPGKDAGVVERFARHLEEHNATPAQIQSVSIDMSPAFIKGVDAHLPESRVTFDKFHVVAHASKALDGVRRAQQKTDPALKGMRWSLLKDADKLNLAQLTDLEALISQYTTNRTARAWMYREQLREILDRKQIHVVSRMLRRWCTGVMRSKVEPMKDVARMILRHFDGIVAWAQTRQTNGFIEAINGLFQAAKRKARGYASFKTMRTVLFLIAGKLDFSPINPHAS